MPYPRCQYSGKSCDSTKECKLVINSQSDPNTYSPRFLMDMLGLDCTFLDEQIDWEMVDWNLKHPPSSHVSGTEVPPEPSPEPEPKIPETKVKVKKVFEPDPEIIKLKPKRTEYDVRTLREIMMKDKIPYDVLIKKMVVLINDGRAKMITPGKFRFRNKIVWSEVL